MSEIIEKFFISKYVCAICKREHTSKEYAELCYDQDVFIQSTPVIYVEDKEKRWAGYSNWKSFNKFTIKITRTFAPVTICKTYLCQIQ